MAKTLAMLLMVGSWCTVGCEMPENCDPATDPGCEPDAGVGGSGGASGASGMGGGGGTGGSGGGSCVAPAPCTTGNEGDLGCGAFCMESVCGGVEETIEYLCADAMNPYCYCLCADPNDRTCVPSI